MVNSASEQLISIYYDELEKDVNLIVNRDDLLKSKCKLFVRFRKFVKSLTLNKSTKVFYACLKITRKLKDIDIQYVPNDKGKHCEVAIFDQILVNNQTKIDFNYILISKLCCPICYFVLSSMGVETRGCHQLVYSWLLSQVYKNKSKINNLHGDLFTRNLEVSSYINDIFKCITHLLFLLKYKPIYCQYESFNENVPVSLYADLNRI